MIMSFCFEHNQPYELDWMCPQCEKELCEEHDKRTEDYYLESDRQFIAELERIEI